MSTPTRRDARLYRAAHRTATLQITAALYLTVAVAVCVGLNI